MKKLFLNVFVVAALGSSLISCKNEANNKTEAKEAEEVAQASEESTVYTVVAEDSEIKWKGSKPAGGSHEGTIEVKDGKFTVAGDSIESGSVVIDMTSIEATDVEGENKENLEAHLKGTAEGKENDFFNVQEYPEATFEITGMEEKDGKTYLSGNLTLKGTTSNVSFPVTTSVNSNNDEVELESETFTIDRTDWNVNFGSKSVFDSLVADNIVSDEIELTIHVKAKKS